MKRLTAIIVSTFLLISLILPFMAPVYAAGGIGIYLKEPTSGLSNPYALGKNEPAFGALVGATIDRDTLVDGRPDRVAEVYGRPYSSVLVYNAWGEQPLTYIINNVKASNGSLQFSWEPSQGLEAVVDNSYVRQIAGVLRDFGNPVFLRFGGEMNGDWSAWGAQPELYKQKFRLIADIMHQTAPNVAMVWAPNYVPDTELDLYYPGDEWVDWVGMSAYSDYYFAGNPANDSLSWTWTKFYQGHKANPMTKFEKIYYAYADRKPIMIAETGVAWANSRPYQLIEGWGASTLKQIYAYIPLIYPRIKGIYYFNSGISKDFSSYNVSINQTMTQAYREAIATPYYLSDYNGTAPFRYQVLNTGNTIPSTECSVAAYVNNGDEDITAVEYYLNGEFIGKSDQAPWEINYQFPATGQAATLQATAVNAGGGAAFNKTIEINLPGPKVSPVQDKLIVKVNGQSLETDVPPYVDENSRTMVPLRAIGEALGATFEWKELTQTVTMVKDDRNVNLVIGSNTAIVDGKSVTLDTKPVIKDQRTMVPARFISESLGAAVDWDATTRTVSIEN